MEYAAFVFGIIGLMAYLELSSLKKRIAELERSLTKMDGTGYRDDRMALVKAAKSYIGKKVQIDLKEDHEDADIVMYGNTKHGSNKIVDADEDWLLVHVTGPKGEKDKLIRMESVLRITAVQPES